MLAGTGKVVAKFAVCAWALSGAAVNAASTVDAGSTGMTKTAPVVTQTAPVAHYESALSGYRRFADQPVGDWREANDLVGRIGGWKTYARESRPDAKPAAPREDAPAAAPSAHDAHH